MAEKQFIKAQELLEDSFRLGRKVLESGFKPDFIVGIWRGGTPVGIAVQELLEHNGVASDHIAIRTSSYEGIEHRGKRIREGITGRFFPAGPQGPGKRVQA